MDGTLLIFTCLSAHQANKGRKVLRNELLERQTHVCGAPAVIRAEKSLLHTDLCCHRRVDTLDCKKHVQHQAAKSGQEMNL